MSARVDEKGRLKLPTALTEYLAALGDKQLFVTTVNCATARIYPISVWRHNESLFESGGDDSEMLEDVATIANHFGADAEVDPQGRVLIPTELRRTLNLEGEQVFLRCFKQRIDVIGKEVYDRRLAKAMAGVEAKVETLEKKGLR